MTTTSGSTLSGAAPQLNDLLESGSAFDIHAFPRPETAIETIAYDEALAADEKLRQFLESEDGNHAKLHQLESEAVATLLGYSRALSARTNPHAA